MTYTTKSLIAASLLTFAAAPAFAAGGLTPKQIQQQAWEKADVASEGDYGTKGPIFQSEVDQFARDLAAGRVSPDADQASAKPVSPRAPQLIDGATAPFGG